MEQSDIHILSGILSGELQQEDPAVQSWLQEDPARAVLLQEPEELRRVVEAWRMQQSFDTGRMWSRITAPATPAVVRRHPGRIIRRAAAAILLLLAAAWWFLRPQHPAGVSPETLIAAKQKPAGNFAVLQAGEETVSLQGKDSSFVLGGNRVDVHNGNMQVATGKSVNYTLRTPRGANYQVQLPDGSKAWLNAQSSIIYPSVFEGSERVVKVTGEVYFEVAAQARQPFMVHAGTQQITVLGTSFCIRSYEGDRQAFTTLVSGKVKVQAGGKDQLLQPGEQAIVSGNQLQVASVDTGDFTSWKDGWIRFRNKPLHDILQTISRWYDVDIQANEQQIVAQYFTCYINKEQGLGECIQSLNNSTNQFSFSLQGSTITVTKK
ncbi:FecR family protein [Chitinophaga qingshengii]|uniref:FecR domain-containing protein n=1 Tax=Chitinophaga qingshengii TaxID=1569794 RepID=A0ABR7TYE6_9BACT|nr:FecR family protein [Chitinophaga qingshengii]MBC9934541.1 FecR domain-containing protein [Chitinophaga qingshengii]